MAKTTGTDTTTATKTKRPRDQTPRPAKALRVMIDALDPLTVEERQRILRSVLSYYGMETGVDLARFATPKS